MIKEKKVKIPNNLIAEIGPYEKSQIQEKYLFHGTNLAVANSIVNGKDIAFNINYAR